MPHYKTGKQGFGLLGPASWFESGQRSMQRLVSLPGGLCAGSPDHTAHAGSPARYQGFTPRAIRAGARVSAVETGLAWSVRPWLLLWPAIERGPGTFSATREGRFREFVRNFQI